MKHAKINPLKAAWAAAQLFFDLLKMKGGKEMLVVVYATLISGGDLTFATVPASLKGQVKAHLEALGQGDLAK